MKKVLISTLIVLLLALSVFITIQGLKIGNLEILGIKGIKEKNEELDIKGEQATRLAGVNYKQAIAEVEESAKKLTEEKKNYEDMTAMNTSEDGQIATQIQKYEIETLWVTLGNHATSEGTIIKMDVMKGSNNIQDTYNLKFTVSGSYISITDFISDIENDTTLGFKIENFKMLPSKEENTLEATFTCNDIYIVDVDTSTVVTDTDLNDDENDDEETDDENTTNTTNTTNNTNETNTTNTTNNSVE